MFGFFQVTSFIREESRQNMQIIVISLKEEFFSKADALLGVYSDVRKLHRSLQVRNVYYVSVMFSSAQFDECMLSRILTLDLRLYALEEEDNGTQSEKETREEGGVL